MTAPTSEARSDAPAVTTGADGLTAAEVTERIARGQANTADERTSRSLGEIARANILTRFNAILGSMLVVILIVGPIQDALFGLVLVANALIGIVQEYRAKRTLDRLAVLNAPRATVVRDGQTRESAIEEIVLDDLVVLRTGDQVAADGIMTVADGLELDESLLTGESESVTKAADDEVLSGSIVVAGTGRFQATRVGADAYARKLATEARRFSLVRSELMDGINLILRYVTWAIVPTAALLALSQFRAHEGWREAMSGVVAGVVAMVPEGLVLLTSLAFAIAAVTLARRQVLVQELPAVEVLARVDVICLDKTGTLTEGTIEYDDVEPLVRDPPVNDVPLTDVLGALAADPNRNATATALAAAFPESAGWERTATMPFSSARKWSGATFAMHGTWVFGAPEMVWAGRPAADPVRRRADELATEGRRVLLLAHTDAPFSGEELPDGLEAVALVLFKEKVRSDAADTLAYFRQQGVALKVISGDNPRTVAAVARSVGLVGADNAVDARELPEDPDALADVLECSSVFGRVSPHQKRAIVGALQSRNHVVAMTGDGVNDALALKDADIGIAMGNGAPATRAVAQVVLLDGRFSTLPDVVAEGRRVIANIERVANLFVTKTVYAMLLALAVGFARWPYPFLPRHLTIVSTLTIGVPAFFLALAPNLSRYQPGFITRVLKFAIPCGFVAAAATFSSYAVARNIDDVTLDEARTTATLVLLVVGLWVLNILARPITPFRGALFGSMVGIFLLILALPSAREFYALEIPPQAALMSGLLIAGVAVTLLEVAWSISQHHLPRAQRTRRLAWRNPAARGSTTSPDA